MVSFFLKNAIVFSQKRGLLFHKNAIRFSTENEVSHPPTSDSGEGRLANKTKTTQTNIKANQRKPTSLRPQMTAEIVRGIGSCFIKTSVSEFASDRTSCTVTGGSRL